jgi:Sulfotransferase family
MTIDPIFEPRSLIDAASDAAGSADLWGDSYRDGLEALCSAIVCEAGLHSARAAWAARMIFALLATRARIAAELREHGDAITGRSIERPIFITGLPRTGTTMLHNIIAGLDGLRGYTPWEMRNVVPKHSDPGWREEARLEIAAMLHARHEQTPELARIHPMGVDLPEECQWLIRHSFASLVFGYLLHVPSYVRWLLGSAQPRAYFEHRAQLQILAHRDDSSARARLILKDPCHLWHLAELYDTYPDALVVRLHRDPLEALPSLCSLMHALWRTGSDHVDPQQVGPLAMDMVDVGLKRERAVRGSQRSLRILDIEYRDLMDDPVATVRRICDASDHPFDERARARVTEWLRNNPRHKAGAHIYTATSFGLDEAEIRERLGDRG